MKLFDSIITWTLFLISISALIGVAQAFFSKGTASGGRAKMLVLAMGPLLAYGWLMYYDGIIVVDSVTRAEIDPFGFPVHPADESWIALLWHSWACAHARLVLLTGFLPMAITVWLFWSRFRKAAGMEDAQDDARS